MILSFVKFPQTLSYILILFFQGGLDFLQAEENLIPRVGAIALGGLTGLIFALRKGMFKKMFYTSIGAGTMAALCYPAEAKLYSQEAFEQARKYTLISYHFLNGGKLHISNIIWVELSHSKTCSHYQIPNNVAAEKEKKPLNIYCNYL